LVDIVVAIAGEDGAYTVRLEAETCTCPATVPCYHLLAVEIFRASARVRARAYRARARAYGARAGVR